MEKIVEITQEWHLVSNIIVILNDSYSDITFYLKKLDRFIQTKFQLELSNAPKEIFSAKNIKISLEVILWKP